MLALHLPGNVSSSQVKAGPQKAPCGLIFQDGPHPDMGSLCIPIPIKTYHYPCLLLAASLHACSMKVIGLDEAQETQNQ